MTEEEEDESAKDDISFLRTVSECVFWCNDTLFAHAVVAF